LGGKEALGETHAVAAVAVDDDATTLVVAVLVAASTVVVDNDGLSCSRGRSCSSSFFSARSSVPPAWHSIPLVIIAPSSILTNFLNTKNTRSAFALGPLRFLFQENGRYAIDTSVGLQATRYMHAHAATLATVLSSGTQKKKEIKKKKRKYSKC